MRFILWTYCLISLWDLHGIKGTRLYFELIGQFHCGIYMELKITRAYTLNLLPNFIVGSTWGHRLQVIMLWISMHSSIVGLTCDHRLQVLMLWISMHSFIVGPTCDHRLQPMLWTYFLDTQFFLILIHKLHSNTDIHLMISSVAFNLWSSHQETQIKVCIIFNLYIWI